MVDLIDLLLELDFTVDFCRRTYSLDVWMSIFLSLLTEPFPAPALNQMIDVYWAENGTDQLKNNLVDQNVFMLN